MPGNSKAGPSESDGLGSNPVFVLCNARSGSTLLRFVLNAHPDLACPPETNVPALSAQLATVWSLIEGAPIANERGDAPPVVPEAALSGVRRTLEDMMGSYLLLKGKSRYCDKSLGTARWANLLMQVFPEAKFICLYRHPMDVVASGIEACPFGVSGYGFDPFIAASPGNVVLALARFWVENAGMIAAAEERFPDACHRVRYEDLVADPGLVAKGIFDFLGVAAQPGIADRIFSSDLERSGPADYKIWHTSTVSSESVGRGWTLPVGMIGPHVLAGMAELTSRLGYVTVDQSWGSSEAPADLRADRVVPSAAAATPASKPRADELCATISRALTRLDDMSPRHLKSCGAEKFGLVVCPDHGERGQSVRLHVDLAARTVTQVAAHGDASTDDTAWDVVGAAEAWTSVMRGRVNLGVALRRFELRYCDTGETHDAGADDRLGMLGALLEMGAANMGMQAAPQSAASEVFGPRRTAQPGARVSARQH
jgi:hypothetical protein